MKKRGMKTCLGVALACAVYMTGCSEKTENIEETQVATTDSVEETEESVEETSVTDAYAPFELTNYNMTTTFEKKPERVVCLSLNSAEIIAALGEADSIIGVQTGNNALKDLRPEYFETLKDVDVPEQLNTGMPPTLEAMLALTPDFVAMNGYYFYVPFFGTVEDYQNNDVKLYVTEGSYVEQCTIENTYNDIRNLGTIFGKKQKADEIVNDMQKAFETVSEQIGGMNNTKVMAFDSLSEDGLYTVAGGFGLEEQLLEMAGTENVFDDVESDFSTVSIEEIIARNPEYIVIHDYTSEENDAQSKIDYLLAQKELADVEAIKNQNFIVVSMFQVTPGIQNVDFVEKVAGYTH